VVRNSFVLCSIVVTTYFCFVVDLQLIEHDGHTPSAADLQLIRAEHLPNGRDSLGRTSATNRGRSQRNAGVRQMVA